MDIVLLFLLSAAASAVSPSRKPLQIQTLGRTVPLFIFAAGLAVCGLYYAASAVSPRNVPVLVQPVKAIAPTSTRVLIIGFDCPPLPFCCFASSAVSLRYALPVIQCGVLIAPLFI